MFERLLKNKVCVNNTNNKTNQTHSFQSTTDLLSANALKFDEFYSSLGFTCWKKCEKKPLFVGLYGSIGEHQRKDTGLNHLKELITVRKEDLASDKDNTVGRSKAVGSSDVISDDAELLNEYIDKISEAKKRTVK